MNRLRWMPVFLPLCAASALAQPHSHPLPTLEWLAATSTVAFRGHLSKVETITVPNRGDWQRVTLAVDETLKGKPRVEVTFMTGKNWVLMKNAQSPISAWYDQHTEILAFLKPRRKPAEGESPDPFPNFPLSPNEPDDDAILSLKDPHVLTTDLRILTTRDNLLTAAKAAIAYLTKEPAKRFEFNIPIAQELREFAGRTVWAPIDDRLKTAAKQWLVSPEPWLREVGERAIH